jgi:hypothetical protein
MAVGKVETWFPRRGEMRIRVERHDGIWADESMARICEKWKKMHKKCAINGDERMLKYFSFESINS